MIIAAGGGADDHARADARPAREVAIDDGRSSHGKARTRAGEVKQGRDGGRERARGRPTGCARKASRCRKVKKKAKDIEIKLPFGSAAASPTRTSSIFTRQFATMIDAGLPIVQCLDILATQAPNKNFGKMLCRGQGAASSRARRFSDALREAPEGLRRPLTSTSSRPARSAASSTRS